MAKNKNIFVTITGFQHYYECEPFQIGNLIRCAKEPGNPYDSDAIRAFLPYIGKVGYIANSPQTKAGGTESASRIYERVPKRFYVRVLFTTCTKIICRVEFGDMSDLNAELESQTEDKWDDWDDEDDEAIQLLKVLHFALLFQLFRKSTRCVSRDECVNKI